MKQKAQLGAASATMKRKRGANGGNESVRMHESAVAGCTSDADAAHSARIVTSLLEWYDLHHRDLPWRRNPYSRKASKAGAKGDGSAAITGDDGGDDEDQRFAYAVWVSETMLQQTQVARVKEYFSRWMARWPTLQSLATTASEDDVNEMWAGLGYYRRGRLLLRGAQLVCSSEEYAGKIPREPAALKGIPGIGEYTAAAIASIAFRVPVAAMDTNLNRVISRMKGIGVFTDGNQTDEDGEAPAKSNSDAGTSAGEMGSAMMQCCEEATHRPGCLNQALMELGARICQARAADCEGCPVRGHCRAHAAERAARDEFGAVNTAGEAYAGMTVLDIPAPKEKKKRREEHFHSFVIVVLDPKTKPFISGKSSVLLTKRGGSESSSQADPGNTGGDTKRETGGLLAGMWEFPSVTTSSDGLEEDNKSTIVTSIAEHLSRSYGITLRGGGGGSPSSGSAGGESVNEDAHFLRVVNVKELGRVKHVFTHMTWHVKSHLVVVDDVGNHSSRSPDASIGWVRCTAFKPASYTSLVRKIWKLVRK